MSAELYRQLNSGAWAVPNPCRCECGGVGQILSDLDTFHDCPIHRSGDRDVECQKFYNQASADTRSCIQEIFDKFGPDAYMDGQYNQENPRGYSQEEWDSYFKAWCSAEVRKMNRFAKRPYTLWDLCRAAGGIVEDHMNELEDLEARSRGYSCALEERWSKDRY